MANHYVGAACCSNAMVVTTIATTTTISLCTSRLGCVAVFCEQQGRVCYLATFNWQAGAPSLV